MSTHPLILVTGPSGAGKTTFASALAPLLGLPVFHKDELKEALFDAFPAASAEDRARFGVASFAMLERLARAILPHGGVIVEANFDGRFASAPWQRLIAETSATARVLELTAPAEILLQRVNIRAVDGSRHSGHAARPAEREVAIPVSLTLDVPTLRLDSTTSPDELLVLATAWLASLRSEERPALGEDSDRDRRKIEPSQPT